MDTHIFRAVETSSDHAGTRAVHSTVDQTGTYITT